MILGQQLYYKRMDQSWNKSAYILLDVSTTQSQDILPLIRKFLLSKIKKFRMFLKPVHFIVRIDLKHMQGMLSNQRLLEQGNNRILRWSLWLDAFDF
jgi:hypothetical protein